MLKIVVMLSLLFTPFSILSKEFVIGINERDIFRHKDAEGNWSGKDIKLIEAVFRRTPYQYKIIAMPWARVIEGLKRGDIDMTLAATPLPERKKFAYFTENNFRYSHHMLFVNKAKLKLFESVKQLSDLTDVDVAIAALRGAIYYESYPALLNDKEFAKRIVYISEELSMLNFVLKGRADGYIDSELEGKFYLLSQPEYSEKIVPLFRIAPDNEVGSKLMFSKKRVSTKQVEVFDNALIDLHKSGEYEEISKLYEINKTD